RLQVGQIVHSEDAPCRIIGASRSKMSRKAFQDFARNAINEHVAEEDLDDEIIETFLGLLHYLSIDATTDAGWDDLKKLIGSTPEDDERIRLFYLAVGPTVFPPIVERLASFKLNSANSRLVIEKPIGRDLDSAVALNDTVGSAFSEDQVFRIDHYLGKETVQNLMALRFANILYEPVWNNAHIDHVQITVAETLGVGSRGNYYDKAGAMRDMVQNHLLQLLCLTAMEPPARFDANAVRDEKLKVLRALTPLGRDEVKHLTVKGQYRAGAIDGEAVKSYTDMIDAEESNTETFVALKAEVSNWRWSGVPFYLRTGKRLATKVSEIVVQFKPMGHNIFGRVDDDLEANKLVIRLQPNEGVKQYLMIKDPGPGGMRFREVPLDMSFADSFNVRNPDAYERLIMDVVRGDQTLFMRRDEVEQAWKWVDPIITAWEESNQVSVSYSAGSSGPPKSFEMITRDGRSWNAIDGNS
ncbi:MAG: glucose-6-phosphate dehydrogenase, partial [Pseudomonadota bacterium]